jgi:hypothetical protein
MYIYCVIFPSCLNDDYIYCGFLMFSFAKKKWYQQRSNITPARIYIYIVVLMVMTPFYFLLFLLVRSIMRQGGLLCRVENVSKFFETVVSY